MEIEFTLISQNITDDNVYYARFAPDKYPSCVLSTRSREQFSRERTYTLSDILHWQCDQHRGIQHVTGREDNIS